MLMQREIPGNFSNKKYILNIHLKDYIILPNKIGYEIDAQLWMVTATYLKF